MKTLLLGMGNPILCDDAVGVRLARDFQEKLAHVPGLDVIPECSVGGLNLLDVFAGYDRVIILDSLWTGGIPGQWCAFTASDLNETIHLTNIHDANFATSLALGRSLGMPLPQPGDIHVFGVEVRENRLFSETMTPELEQGYPEYSSAILSAVEELLRT